MALESGSVAQRFGYRPELDGVRGVAILLVIWHHLGLLDVPRLGAGFMGVDVFFVLSGFLITTLLLDERRSTGHIRLGAFYVRRALRLLPALLLMLVVAGVAVYAHGEQNEIDEFTRSLPWVLLYAGNWRGLDALGILTHTWSLAIEEQFYLLWPPVVLLAMRRRVDPRILVGALIASVVALQVVSAGWGSVPLRSVSRAGDVVIETYTRAMGILLGCLIALLPVLRRYVHDAIVGIGAVAGACVVLVVRRDPSTFHYRIGYLAFVLFVAIALAHVAHVPQGSVARALRWRPLVATGRVSYGLYLFHVPVFLFLRWEEPVELGLTAAVLGLLAVCALTLWSWFIVERPALRLQTRFRSRHGTGGPDQIARASTAE